MPKGDKFIELANYFKRCKEGKITLPFNKIEQILGFPLSPSAYKYSAYWHKSETHTFPNAWLSEGYKLESLDIRGRTALFIKVNTAC